MMSWCLQYVRTEYVRQSHRHRQPAKDTHVTDTKIVSVSVFNPQQTKIKIFFVFSIFPVEAFRFSFWIKFLRRFGSTEVFRFEATLDTQWSTQTYVMDLTFFKMNDSNRLHAFQFELGTTNLPQNNRSTTDDYRHPHPDSISLHPQSWRLMRNWKAESASVMTMIPRRENFS